MNDSPNKYQPNPVDDRKLSGTAAAAYLNLATAIEQIAELTTAPDTGTLGPKVTTALRTAEGAMRRAAWMVVAYNTAEGPTA